MRSAIAAAGEREARLFSLQAKHSLLGLLNGSEILRLAVDTQGGTR